MVGHRPGGDLIRDALLDAIRLVYEFAGMVAIEQMWKLVNVPTNVALTIGPVASDAVKYKEAYLAVKSEFREGNWPSARSILPGALSSLNSEKFPDLYVAANVAAVAIRGFKKENYTTSAHATAAPMSTIRKRARQVVGSGSTLSDDTVNKLKALGAHVDDMARMIGDKRRRPDPDTTKSDDESSRDSS